VICQGMNTTLNAGSGYTSYLWNTGAITQTINVSIGTTYTVTVTNGSGCTGTDDVTIVVNPLPIPPITGTFTICQGSTTTLVAGPGYSSYLWSTGQATPSIIVGTQGTYTVTATDANGCSGTSSIFVTVNPNPVPSISGNQVLCSGGTVSLSANAGYAAYQWSNGAFTPTIVVNTPGTYTVTVTDVNGCTGSDSETVISGNVNVNITGNTFMCQGQSTVLNAGVGFTSYLWSTGANTQTISVTTSGTYYVTVTNAGGCTGTDSIVVTVNPLPVPIITGTIICQGSPATLNAGAGYTNYLWSTGSVTQSLQVTLAGIYTVTVTNANGCTGSDTALVSVFPLPSASAIAMGNTSFCVGDSLLLNVTSGFPGYLWYRYNSPVFPLNTTEEIYVKTQGRYYCRVTDSNGCTVLTNKIKIEPPCIPIGGAGQRDITEEIDEEIIIYPNPSTNTFNVSANYELKEETEIYVMDLTGRKINCVIEKLNEYELLIKDMPVGIFILKIDDKNLRIIKLE